MGRIHKDMYVKDILELDPGIAGVFLKNDLNCLGCPGGKTETLAEAARGHDVDLEKLIGDLNRFLDGSGDEPRE